jgi:hypothetical protein
VSGQLWGITTTDSPGATGYNTGFATSLDPWSTLIDKQNDCTFASSEIGEQGYTRCFGATSAASPITAGIAGLLLSVDPGLSRTGVYDILRNTADKIDGAQCAYVSGLSKLCGWGRVNAFAALEETSGTTLVGEAKSGTEVGVRIGITWIANAIDRTTVNLPAGGPQGFPVVHVARVTPDSHIELQLGFRRDAGTAGDATEVVAALQPAAFLGGSALYAGLNIAVRRLDTGTASTTEGAYGGAVGYRWLPGSNLSLRLEARYRYWPGPSLHEAGLALAAGVIL